MNRARGAGRAVARLESSVTASLLFKVVVVILLLAILASLTGGLAFLVRDKGRTDRTVKSLTLRIVLSVLLFLLLIVGFATGLIAPHGVTP
jgi:signal transduction histidine kinase